MDLKNILAKTQPCAHKKKTKIFGQCHRCYRRMDHQFGECQHKKTSVEKELLPSSYALIVHDNYEDKIVMERKYTQDREDAEPVIQHFLKCLYNDVLPTLSPLMIPHEAMELSEAEELAFIRASRCYLCNKKISGSDKHREHCHATGAYRGGRNC